MRDLNYQLKRLAERNCDGSFATRSDRNRMLSLIANQLYALGFRHMTAASLKPKHVAALVALWHSEKLSTGTIKNRMSALRWWAEKIGKPNVMDRGNGVYGIADRVFVTNESKAVTVGPDQLALIKDEFTAMSLRMQAAFGLRREESIKLIPDWADQGDFLRLKDSWTKGGRYREVPVITLMQRATLNDAKVLVGKGSLIPPHMSYREQLHRFISQCAQAGIHRVHGQRHQYAQQRYLALTGWLAPAAGGPHSRMLTGEQKQRDRDVRLEISNEMGHGREQITAVYLGR
ncbi:phage integrase N-terminal domain-containing protein [Pseudoduganella sp. GCM10020061]|uniref:phage integrase N-terminal domain-containing protein n=1 Tax=Pseudoduganella sp. GCM10020061 TaxID=3317345 RepID=UPI00362C0E34